MTSCSIASRPKCRFDRDNFGFLLAFFAGLVRRLEYAVGATAQPDLAVGRRSGRQDRRRYHHHRDRAVAGFRRHVRRFSPLVQIVFGLSIAFAASSFFLSFFSFGGGVVIRRTSSFKDLSRPCTAP